LKLPWWCRDTLYSNIQLPWWYGDTLYGNIKLPWGYRGTLYSRIDVILYESKYIKNLLWTIVCPVVPFSFSHCIVGPHSIYGFWLHLWNQASLVVMYREPSWWWSHCSWIYSYMCNQCLAPPKLWIRIPLMARCTWYNIMW